MFERWFPPKGMVPWRFWLPLLLQTGLVAMVPAQAIYTQLMGETVILQTAPVDPYDVLRGYSVTLGYEISNVNVLQELPGAEVLSRDQPFYVVLAAPDSAAVLAPLDPSEPSEQSASTETAPAPWQPIRISQNLPTHLPDDQVALRGILTRGRALYGLETYYIPEDERQQIDRDIQRSQIDQGRSRFVVEVKVNAQGRAVPVQLWTSQQRYRF